MFLALAYVYESGVKSRVLAKKVEKIRSRTGISFRKIFRSFLRYEILIMYN